MRIPSVSTFVPVDVNADEQPPPYAPPYEPAFDVQLPSSEKAKKRLDEQRDQQPASSRHDSAAAALLSAAEPVASPFAVLGEPPIARGLVAPPQDAGIIVIGGADASGIDSPLDDVALNPQPLPPRDTPADIDEPGVAASALHLLASS